MIEINVNTVDYFLKNGYMGFTLNYKNIESYDAHVSKVCNSPYPNENRIMDRNCWSYVLYYSEPNIDLLFYFVELNDKKYGVINIPLNMFTTEICDFTSKPLKEIYEYQLRIIELAKKYYKEKIELFEISIECEIVIDHDIIVGIKSMNVLTEAYIHNKKVIVEKTFRDDIKNYIPEYFDIDCSENRILIDMITE